MRLTGGFWDSVGCLWILGPWCWQPYGGELLDIAIPTLVPPVFLLSLACPCLCNDEIKSEHAHNRHVRGVGWGM